MKYWILLLTILYFSNGFSQTARFRNELKRILVLEDSLSSLNPNFESGTERISLANAAELVGDNVLSICQKYSKRTVLDQSQTLMKMAHSCSKFFRSNKFSRKDKIRRLKREIRRLQRPIITRFGIIHVYSFTIPIYENNQGKFFYDRNGPDGEPNLYKGNKRQLKRKLKEGEEIEYEHLEGFQLDKINEEIKRQLSRKKILPILKKGNYSFVGIDAELNRQSNRKQLPEVRVVLFFGARRLHRVKTNSTS